MIFRKLACWLLLCVGVILSAQEGKNLLQNGDFTDIADERATGWSYPRQSLVKMHENGGPNNHPYMEVIGTDEVNFENIIRERSIQMVPGEDYLIRAWINTKNFKARRGELVLTDAGWYHESGIHKLPENTNGWQKIEMKIKTPTADKFFNFVILSIGQTGYWAITDVELLPLTPKAIAGSKPAAYIGNATMNRLFPWTPCFNAVPLWNPVVSFKWYEKNDKALRAMELEAQGTVAAAGYTSPKVAAVHGEAFAIELKGVPAGLQTVAIKIQDKATGKVVHEESFLVNLRDLPKPEEVTAGTRLNNMTVEVVHKDLAAAGEASFVLGRDRWMYFTVKNPARRDFTMTLDGKKIDDCATRLPEAFRFVEAGKHTFAVNCKGTLIARTISELFTCAVCEGPRITNFPEFNWDFAKKWILPALTHCNRGTPSETMLQEAHASGRIWTGNLWAVNPPSVEEMHKRLNNTMPGVGKRDGVTADELFYATPEIDNYTQALKANAYDREKLIYTWACQLPSIRSAHTDFIATCLNASHGRGKIMREAYIGANTTDEKKAYEKAYNDIVEYYRVSSSFYPEFMSRAGMVLGNFNQINVITLEHCPEVDYKYYLDMQMNILANDPVFLDLGLVGYWGTHYSDEEMYRWSHALLRHYVVEGRKEMLSKKYGFSYTPGHIRNNDFADGLDGWEVNAAEAGSVSTDSFKELNNRNQDRWGGAGNIGNTFCKVKVVAGKPNTVSQVARNLVPGKQYMLLFIAGDYDDLKAQKFNPRNYWLEARIEGASIDESFIFYDKREKGNYAHNHGIARQNLYRYIFTPKGTEVKITFTDANANPGETLMFNYVQVKPFFPKVAY